MPSTWWVYVNTLHHKDPNDQWSYVTPYQRRLMENCDKQYVRRGAGVPPSVTNHDLVNKGLQSSGLTFRPSGDKKFEVEMPSEYIEIECDHESVWTKTRVNRESRHFLKRVFERLTNPDVGWRNVGLGRPGGKRRKTDAMYQRQRDRQGRRSPSPAREVRHRSRSRRRRVEAAPSEEPSRRRRSEAAPSEEPSRRRRAEAAPAREPSTSSDRSSDRSPPPPPSGHRDESASSASSNSSASPELEAREKEPEVELFEESRGRRHTIEPSKYVPPTLSAENDQSKLLETERDPKWRKDMCSVYDRHPELIDKQFAAINKSTKWRRCLLCGKDIGTGHEDTVTHLERMKSAFDNMDDGEKIAATKAWLAIPPDVEMPKSYVNFCRVVGVDTIGKRLELAEATKVQEMKEKQTAIKQER